MSLSHFKTYLAGIFLRAADFVRSLFSLCNHHQLILKILRIVMLYYEIKWKLPKGWKIALTMIFVSTERVPVEILKVSILGKR